MKSLFEAASAVPAADRARFLADAVSDPDVLHEVQRLLAADAAASGGWVDRVSASIADHVSLCALEPGQSIGPYRIEEQIGRGGMGVVYRAYDTRLERPVALKLVDDVTLDATARSSLLREAQCASALSHPHVCTVFDFGQFDGTPYIVMEWIDGRALSGLTRPAGLPADAAMRYAVQVAEALAHAHARGVVHGDLKSANVLISRDHRAKLLDFGLARRVHREAETVHGSRSPHGTPLYMAPEVLRGEAASARSDVWSFGCVLQELLTGALPFSGSTMPALVAAILDDAPSPLPANVAREIRLVVATCLSREPLERYRDGSELARALGATAGSTAHQADDRRAVTATVSSRHAAVDPEAYALYQRGHALFFRGTRRDLDAAVQLFDQATTLAPHFAVAHAALAHTFGKIHRFSDRDEQWLRRGMAAAERALALQPQLAEAFAAIAYLHYAHEEYQDALRFAYRALELKADCETAYSTLGYTLYWLDRFDEAVALVERAVETSGHDFSVYTPYRNVLRRLGRTEEAALLEDKMRRVLEWHVAWAPDNVRAHILLATIYGQLERREDALREVEIAVAFDPDDPSTLLNAGCAYALLGMKTEAIAMLRRSIQSGYWHPGVLERDPDLASLRGEAEFQRLLREGDAGTTGGLR